MINCTKHSTQRWVERILEIKEKALRDEYVRDNIEIIKEHMNDTFSYAEFIYKGQIGDNITRNYFIQNDIIFVTNTTNDAIITVYKVDFGFTNEINLTVAKELVKEIHKLVEEKDEIDFKQLVEKERLEDSYEKLTEEAVILKQQLAIIEGKKKSVKANIDNLDEDSSFIQLSIKKHTNNLVNSKEYRDDLKEVATNAK